MTRYIPLARLLIMVSLLITGVVLQTQAENSFYIQPYLQNVTQTGITIQWWTDQSEPSSQVEYGLDFQNVTPASDEWIPVVGKVRHRAVLSGLEPETPYRYRVRSGTLVSPEYTFHTAVRRSSGFHVVMFGDGRTDDDVIRRHRGITRLAWAQHPDLAFHGGDGVYSGDSLHWDRFWRRIATASDPDDPGLPFASQIPYYLVVGNHEIYSRDSTLKVGYDAGNLTSTMARFQAYVDTPPNGTHNPDWEKRYYAFNYGVATFIVLDTNNTSDDSLDNHIYLPDGSTPDWEPGSEQYEWLIRRLKTARDSSAFTLVLMHPSPYCRGVHGDPNESQSGGPIRALDPVFRQYGVDAVLTSHDHLVERCLTGPLGYEQAMDETDPANLNYVVMGNSGQSARDAQEGWATWMDITGNDGPPYYTQYFYDWAGTDHVSFVDISIDPLGHGQWKAHFQIIRDDGEIFDPFSLERTDPLFSEPTDIERPESQGTPQGMRLRQNRPNPFNSRTWVEFALMEASGVSLKVYDLLGRRVQTLFEGGLSPGNHSTFWDGKDYTGATVASGPYVCVMTIGAHQLKRTMMLMR